MKQNQAYDAIITGGGIMGSSTAYYLTRMHPGLKVAVVERDPTYARASTTLSMSNVRIQFSLKENIQISQYAFQVFERFEDEMTVEERRPKTYFRREGNLFLVNAANHDAARHAFDLQRGLGCRVEWWSPEQIRDRYPLYDPGADIPGATFGPDDGHFDAYAALMACKAQCRSKKCDNSPAIYAWSLITCARQKTLAPLPLKNRTNLPWATVSFCLTH